MSYKELLLQNGFKEVHFGYPKCKSEDYKFREFRKGRKTITYSETTKKFFANNSGVFNANFISFDNVESALKHVKEL